MKSVTLKGRAVTLGNQMSTEMRCDGVGLLEVLPSSVGSSNKKLSPLVAIFAYFTVNSDIFRYIIAGTPRICAKNQA